MTMTGPTTVLSDPQMTVETLMRPQRNFESIYSGESRDNPLYWFPNGEPLDEQAGQSGFDQNLIRGVSVTPGSTLHLWLPNVYYAVNDEILGGYQWFYIWRLRNLRDYRQTRTPYHLSRSLGVVDSTPTPNEARVLVPAAYQSVVYSQQPSSDPTTPDASRPANQLRAEDILVNAQRYPGPLLDTSGTTGAVEQGVFDPASNAEATRPYYQAYSLKVPAADEVVIGCLRTQGDANWGFEDPSSDRRLGDFLDGPHNGVYLFRGVDNGSPNQARTDIGVP